MFDNILDDNFSIGMIVIISILSALKILYCFSGLVKQCRRKESSPEDPTDVVCTKVSSMSSFPPPLTPTIIILNECPQPPRKLRNVMSLANSTKW